MASVVFEYVTKKFDTFVAVNDLNLNVEDGEFLVFVGPSGCGKTTSLRMLAGLENVTEGNIYIGDKRVNDMPPKDRDIAMVFQSYALYPHMSVYENMAFSLELQGKRRSEIKTRVEAAAKQLGIDPLLHRKPKELSGGQRQRVAVGRAIVRNPAVFLMDEPLSNLDAKLRVQARAEISKLHKELGTTFIYVTHDQVEAMTMGTHIAVMNGGVLQQMDTPQNLYNYPKNVFVAGFIGSPAMNFFEAKLTSRDSDLYITTDSFEFQIPAEWVKCYQPYQSQEVIFGIRPENIHDPDYVPPGIEPTLVRATVSVTEMMGNEVIVYLNTATGQEFVARVDPRSHMAVGQSVSIVFDRSYFHLFDKPSQQAIT
ncbi:MULTISPECIES: ABC transporter ATP-binding protein [unclassified Coleofasciculus]|uniref:ABC transporter ATP-binding protein n=1 Tax=unclassified Coleofasciculus TaxID=2692782 RepID=UPI00187F5DA2|nr:MULTISPECIES: ABC transporter ATP-binding protein [unclassified Coleofasciculus]MBE9129136.1 ABC transporter ATP-binding protein [Coleofasciculus sp. LEGE 07081]MBE9149515.1 ABC transporter ATP-binding protein [Coleofasciculus sp. LEGE 07092]